MGKQYDKLVFHIFINLRIFKRTNNLQDWTLSNKLRKLVLFYNLVAEALPEQIRLCAIGFEGESNPLVLSGS